MEDYYIDERGIFVTRSVYHDDVDYVYHVEFDSPNVTEQFSSFLERVRRDGANEKIRELKLEFRNLRQMLS